MFQHALDMGANIVVTLDSDGQRNPNEFPRLLEPILKDKADFMLGSRYMHGGTMDAPLYQRIGLWIIYSVCKGGSRYKIRDTQNGFRAFSRKALEAMVACQSDDYGIETEQLSIATHFGLMIKEVSVSVKYCDLANISSENPVSHGTELIETAVKLVVKRRPLPITGTGEETRDFTYVGDIVDGLLSMAYYEDAVGEAFNLGSGREIVIRDLARLVNQITGNSAGIIFKERRDWDKKSRLLSSIDKARRILNYEPKTEFTDGLRSVYSWFKINWDHIKKSAEF